MTPVRIRPFARGDRDQLAALVNAHLAAVTPGASISVQALLSHLERQPAEFIVDPWVTERVTLVAEQRHRIVAAAHLLRHGADKPVGSFYRDTADMRWLVCYLPAPFWPDAGEAGTQLIQACLAVLGTWQVRQSFADGTLPGPGVYGVPAPWPHIRELYRQAGFTGGRNETVLAAAVVDLHHTRPVPQPGFALPQDPRHQRHSILGCHRRHHLELHRGRHQPGRSRSVHAWRRLGRHR